MSSSDASAKIPGYRTVALIVSSALFMQQIDSTVLATALPTMADTFHVSALHMSIALTSYLLSLSVFIPASGMIADRFGSRRIFCSAILLFLLGSVLCSQSASLPVLVIARLIQGIGGAMMLPVGRLVMLRSVRKTDLVAATNWFMVPAVVGPIIGPPIGGLIVTYLSWQWIFYVNLPIGLAGLFFAWYYLPDVREIHPARFDWLGLLMSGTSLSCLMFGLEMATRGAFSFLGILTIIGGGILAGIFYVLYACRHDHPILDITLMRVPTFQISVLGGALTRITGGAMPFLMPMMMQVGFGMSALESGFITFMSAAGSMLMRAPAPVILRRLGFRRTLIWSAVISSVVMALCAAFRPGWPLLAIYAVLLIGGFFMSLQFTAYNTVAYADIPSRNMSAATSFYATFQQLMLSLGICVSSGALHVSVSLSGRSHATLADFSAAFLTVTFISILAAPVCARLPPAAGDDMTGHSEKKTV